MLLLIVEEYFTLLDVQHLVLLESWRWCQRADSIVVALVSLAPYVDVAVGRSLGEATLLMQCLLVVQVQLLII